MDASVGIGPLVRTVSVTRRHPNRPSIAAYPARRVEAALREDQKRVVEETGHPTSAGAGLPLERGLDDGDQRYLAGGATASRAARTLARLDPIAQLLGGRPHGIKCPN